MVETQLHLHGEQTVRRTLPAIPAARTYLRDEVAGGRLWLVDAVVLEGLEIHAYLIAVSDRQEASLTRAWASWGDSVGDADPASR